MAKEITIKSPQSQLISTTLTDEIRNILEKAGFRWFELRGTLEVNLETFRKIDTLVTPQHS